MAKKSEFQDVKKAARVAKKTASTVVKAVFFKKSNQFSRALIVSLISAISIKELLYLM